MSGFQFDYYHSPYTATIADLIRQPYAAAATRAQQTGDASARMWGSIGNTVSGTLGDLLKYQMEAPKRQAELAHLNAQTAEDQAQAAERIQKTTDQNALDAAFARPQGPTENGELLPAPTRDQILNSVPGHLRAQVQQHFDAADEAAAKARKTKLDATEAQADYMGSLASSVRTFNYEPGAAMTAIAHARDTYKDDPQMVGQLDQIARQIQDDPTKVKSIVDALLAQSPKQRELDIKEGKAQGFTLGRGQTRYDADGNEIASAPADVPAGSDYQRALNRREAEVGHQLSSKEELAFRTQFESAGYHPEREDLQYTRDWNQYKEYVDQYNRTQPKGADPLAIGLALGKATTPEQVNEVLKTSGAPNYKMPDDFNTWRVKNKGIDASGAKPGAPAAPSNAGTRVPRAAAPAPGAPAAGVPAAAAPMSTKGAALTLPAGTAVGDTVMQDGKRLRVKAVNGNQLEMELATDPPKVGDIQIYNGQRYKIASITKGQARLDPIP